MESTAKPIQILSDTLNSLEARLDALDHTQIQSNHPIQLGPIIVLQERIANLNARIRALSGNVDIPQMEQHNLVQPIQRLNVLINSITTQVKEVEETAAADTPDDPIVPIVPITPNPPNESESSDFKFSYKKATDSSKAYIQISASNPPKPY